MRHFLLAAVAALALAACATADDIVVPVVVRPGSIGLAPVTAAARGGRITTTVVDARGKGAGWTLLARSTGPAGTYVVASVELRCAPRSTCTLPRSDMRYPVLLTPLRPAPVLRALPASGLGAISVTLRLAAPARFGASLRFTLRPS